MTVEVKFLHPRATWDHVGVLPMWLDPDDPRPAREQLDAHYRHGGGWRPFEGFQMKMNGALAYPGDPMHFPIAEMHLRDEKILMYEHAWVAIVQKDRSYEVCRMD